MQFHRCLSVVAASTLLLPSTAHAQQAQSIPGDVTFELPVNLTRISGAISKVMVTCNISSAALAGSPNKKLAAQVELPVVAGQVVTTVGVVVPVTAESFLDPTMTDTGSPTGKPATYDCRLMGFSRSPASNGGGWNYFSPDSTIVDFRLSPALLPITGSFVW